MKQRIITLLLAIMAFVPQLWAETKAGVEQKIRLANNYWQKNNSPESSAFWNWAAYHTGNMEVYKLLRDDSMLQYSIRWAEHNKWKGATEPDRRLSYSRCARCLPRWLGRAHGWTAVW